MLSKSKMSVADFGSKPFFDTWVVSFAPWNTSNLPASWMAGCQKRRPQRFRVESLQPITDQYMLNSPTFKKFIDGKCTVGKDPLHWSYCPVSPTHSDNYQTIHTWTRFCTLSKDCWIWVFVRYVGRAMLPTDIIFYINLPLSRPWIRENFLSSEATWVSGLNRGIYFYQIKYGL